VDNTHAAAFKGVHAVVDTGTERLPCRRVGEGPALLFVHGFPLSGHTWRKIVGPLSKHFTCYLPDLPGMGESEWTDETDFSFPGQGRTLERLADALGLTSYAVIAQDTGGSFARFLALEDPRVDRLVLLNTEMPGHRPPWIPLYQFLVGVPGTLSVFKLLLQTRAFNHSPMGFGGCFCDRRLIDGEFQRTFIQPLVSSARRREGMQRYLQGAKWPPVDALEQDHARIRIPVQLVWGADDPTFPVAIVREMVKQFPDAKLVEVPGAALLVHEEKPEAVIEAVLPFLTAAARS
jgi:pimeloyl-ACP methyl ester carboxylesterase